MTYQTQDVGQTIKINPLDLNDNVAIGVIFPYNANAVFNSSYTTQDQVKSNLIIYKENLFRS